MNPRRTLFGLLLGAAMGLTGCQPEPSGTGTSGTAAKKPTQVLKDFVMNDVRNGVKTMSLVSVEGRVYETEKYADVDQPVIFFYKQGKESSRLTAPAGRIQMESHEVETWGGVTVVSADSSTLTTERLRYSPKTQKITSTDTVHLEKPDSVTDGIGLETDPELKTVKIGKQKVRFKKGI